jgi:hypothetical protein
MPANVPMKSIHGVDRTPKRFAAATPRAISIIATEMPDSTDAIDATRMSAARIIAAVKSAMGC